MKRDLSLVRKLLERIEESKFNSQVGLSIDEYDQSEIIYHVKLLYEADYIDAIDYSSKSGLDFDPQSLTWKGHEFLDAIRNETAINKVKEKAGGDLSNIPFEILKNVLGETIKFGFKPLWT